MGGSTTVNWTSSFRTPSATLKYWQDHFSLPDMNDESMSPWFQQAEQRLNIGPWLVAPNVNNELLKIGAARLGIPAAAIARNVKGCWNLGSCGLGCPTNAKQSMLVTTIPTALDKGATLLVQMRAERLELAQGKVQAVTCIPVNINGSAATGAATRVQARHFVVSGGAINSPGLLLRSGAPDPHRRLGLRTFLHPVVLSAAVFDKTVAGWDGAPQTMYTDHFLEVAPIDGPIGYKLEAPPMHPVLASTSLPGFGDMQAKALKDFPNTHALLALLRDGFHDEARGGQVKLRSDKTAVLDYTLTPFIMDGARRALLSMAEIQFAAGARSVTPGHQAASPFRTWAEAKAAIASWPMVPYQTKVVSAHVMGGCGMAGKAELGVVQPDGRHWHLENLSIHDGSLFPTSIGANPQLSVYGLVNKLATGLARALTGREVRLA